MRIIDRNQLQELMRDGAQVVEVLPREGYEQEHIDGAINIPLKQMDEDALERLDKDRPVVTYCASYT